MNLHTVNSPFIMLIMIMIMINNSLYNSIKILSNAYETLLYIMHLNKHNPLIIFNLRQLLLLMMVCML